MTVSSCSYPFLSSSSSTSSTSDSPSSIRGLDHVNLMITDMPQALLFFCSCLGFTLESSCSAKIATTKWLSLGKTQLHLAVGSSASTTFQNGAKIGLISSSAHFRTLEERFRLIVESELFKNSAIALKKFKTAEEEEEESEVRESARMSRADIYIYELLKEEGRRRGAKMSGNWRYEITDMNGNIWCIYCAADEEEEASSSVSDSSLISPSCSSSTSAAEAQLLFHHRLLSMRQVSDSFSTMSSAAEEEEYAHHECDTENEAEEEEEAIRPCCCATNKHSSSSSCASSSTDSSSSLSSSLLGINFLQLTCQKREAEEVNFYFQHFFSAKAEVVAGEDETVCIVDCDRNQRLFIVESSSFPPLSSSSFAPWHYCLFISNFRSTFERLSSVALIAQLSPTHDDPSTLQEAEEVKQFRCYSLLNRQMKPFHAWEQEIRSLLHPSYEKAKRLVNQKQPMPSSSSSISTSTSSCSSYSAAHIYA